MMKLTRVSIRTKLFGLIVGMTLAIGLLLTLFIRPIMLEKLQMELIEKGEFMASNLARSSAECLLNDDIPKLKTILSEFGKDDNDTAFLYVLDSNGEVVADTFADGFPKIRQEISSGPARDGHRQLLVGADKIIDVAEPIMEGRLGWVHVGLSEDIVRRSASTVVSSIMAVILAVLCASMGVTFVFARILVGPLNKLVRVAEAVGHGDFEQELDIASEDELQALGTAFNKMIGDLRRTTVSKDDFQKQSNFLHEVLAAIPYPFYVVNVEDYTVELANPATAPGEPWGQTTCYRLTHGNDTPCREDDGCVCPLAEIKKTGQPVRVEHVHRNTDGSEQVFEVHGYPLFDQDRQLVKMIEFSIDITQRKAAEKNLLDSRQKLRDKNAELQAAHRELQDKHSQMLQQEKMASIGQLAAGVAHEINNPMGFITSNLGTLRKYCGRLVDFIETIGRVATNVGPEEQALLAGKRKDCKIDYVLQDLDDLLQESIDGANRVTEIVQNLKSFARLDDQSMRLADINVCLENTLKVIWNELKYKAEIRKDFGELPKTVCLPSELNQVFMNILVNAAQAIDVKGEISIKTRIAGEMIMVTIADTGCGIPQDRLHRVFEPFYTSKPVGKGTGLGMSISYEIVKKHRGEITVQSDEGQGTIFTVTLPIREEGFGA